MLQKNKMRNEVKVMNSSCLPSTCVTGVLTLSIGKKRVMLLRKVKETAEKALNLEQPVIIVRGR